MRYQTKDWVPTWLPCHDFGLLCPVGVDVGLFPAEATPEHNVHNQKSFLALQFRVPTKFPSFTARIAHFLGNALKIPGWVQGKAARARLLPVTGGLTHKYLRMEIT